MRPLGNWIAAAVCALSLAAPGARAQESPGAGEVVNRLYRVEGVQVPLPAGAWTVAGVSERDDLKSAALLRVENDSVLAAVLLHVSRRRATGAWGVAPACERDDLPYAHTRSASDHDSSCAWVARVVVGGAPGSPASAVDPAWEDSRRLAAERGWTLPTGWALTGVRVSQPQANLQVRYALPLAPGAAQAAALWGWMGLAWDMVEKGLHKRLEEKAPLQPLPRSAGLPLMAAAHDGHGSGLSRAIWKTITFRVIGSTIDFTTNMVVTGSVATSLALSSLPILIGPWIYLGHELAWETWGQQGNGHRELPGFGAETGFTGRTS